MNEKLFGVAAALVRNGMQDDDVEAVVWQIPLEASRRQTHYHIIEELFKPFTDAVKKIHRPTYIELMAKARRNEKTSGYEVPVKTYNAALLNLAGK